MLKASRLGNFRLCLNNFLRPANDLFLKETFMRNYAEETEKRVDFIKEIIKNAGAKGVVFGNSGGKDSALVGVLCKLATPFTTGIIMPCGTSQNYTSDLADATALSEKFEIAYKIVDLTKTYKTLCESFPEDLTDLAKTNIPPRLRMATLYAYAQSNNLLVAGTGNFSERYMGYFTKWGDSGYDFNPIADLTATEVFEFLTHLQAPENIIAKPPSAGLYEGQTDELEMGVTYKELDNFLLFGKKSAENQNVIDRAHAFTEHKRKMPPMYGEK